jgi:K+-sensing histidine kinase KdpD
MNREQCWWLVSSFCFIVIIGFVDYVSGYEISLSILYLGPISLVAWFVNQRLALLVALLCAIVWLFADIYTGNPYSNALIPYWNMVVRLGIFIVVAVLLSELKKTLEQQSRVISDLQKALAEIKTLSGLLPICGWCKHVRDDRGYWKQVELYIEEHSDVKFSHFMCPRCAENFKKEPEAPPKC